MNNICLYLCKHFFCEKFSHALGSDRMEGIIYRYSYALLTFTHAERTAKLDLAAEIILVYQILKLLDYLTRAFYMTGASDTNRYFKHKNYLSFKYLIRSGDIPLTVISGHNFTDNRQLHPRS